MEKNKILISVSVPKLEDRFEIFVPVTKKIGNVIILLNKSLVDLTNNIYIYSEKSLLINEMTGEIYDFNKTIKECLIKDGTKVILI